METRHILIALDGRHIWMGRHTAPSQEELHKNRVTLEAMGITAWHGTYEGDYWSRKGGKFTDMQLLTTGLPGASLEEAVAAFQGKHVEALNAADPESAPKQR